MKLHTQTFFVIVGMALVLSQQANAQSTFQNLNFESAVIIPVPGDPFGRVDFAAAFPGWTGYLGTNQQALALHNNLFIGSAAISLLGPGWSSGGIIHGNYTAVLQAGGDLEDSLSPVDASIAQTGLIPYGTMSIRFTASEPRNGLRVAVNGETIDLFVLVTVNGYNIYGGDISQYAALTADLRITALSAPSRPANLYLDSIFFSDQPFPEPAVLGLFALGAALLGRRLRKIGIR